MTPLRPLLALVVLVSLPAAAFAREQSLDHATDARHAPSPAPSGDLAPAVQTQSPSPQPLLQFGLGLMMGVPVGEFSDNVDFSAGLTGHLDFGIGRSPISVGVEGTALWYGSESRDVPLVGVPGLTVDVDTSNEMYLFHGRVRAQKPEGRVRPYVDGLVGFNYILTRTSVDDDDDDDNGDSITNQDDLVLSAGGGAGVMFAFGPSPHSVRLDLSVRYLYGGTAEYLTEEDIRWREEGPVILQPRRSRTDMVMVYIGLAFGR